MSCQSAEKMERVSKRLEEILRETADREQKKESLEVRINVTFLLRDMDAVRFQIAPLFLMEFAGLSECEVVGELLSIGLQDVLEKASEFCEVEEISLQDTVKKRLSRLFEACAPTIN